MIAIEWVKSELNSFKVTKILNKFFVLNSDIALIKLPEPVEFSDVIKPISFPCSVSNGMDVIAVGNGFRRDYDRGLPPILQYTELKTVSMLSCSWNYPVPFFSHSVICVKGKEHKSVCHGNCLHCNKVL